MVWVYRWVKVHEHLRWYCVGIWAFRVGLGYWSGGQMFGEGANVLHSPGIKSLRRQLRQHLDRVTWILQDDDVVIPTRADQRWHRSELGSRPISYGIRLNTNFQSRAANTVVNAIAQGLFVHIGVAGSQKTRPPILQTRGELKQMFYMKRLCCVRFNSCKPMHFIAGQCLRSPYILLAWICP